MKTDKTKKPGVFRFIELSDVHLGHRQTPTQLVIDNFWKIVTDDFLKDLDMIIIAGDLFDRQLNNGDDNANLCNRFITLLLFKCAAYNVMLRVVEGTPSHDREQSRFFIEQKNNVNIPVDLFYTKKLEIEYNEKLDAYFLYVPDKWHPNPNVTFQQIKEQMAKLGIEKVDFAIMHGAFTYQLPSIVEEPCHNEEDYLSIVKHLILIGHVHIMTVKDRILSAGSFDRNGHNDEIPKGLFDVKVKQNGEWSAKFIENKTAKRYDTLDVHSFDTKQLNFAVKEHIKNLPDGSAIRLRCNPQDVATGDIESFMAEYPKYQWSLILEKSTDKKSSVVDCLKEFNMAEFTNITKDTIQDLITAEMTRLNLDPIVHKRLNERLEEFI